MSYTRQEFQRNYYGNKFRVNENEVYMIKDSNLKKINDIIKLTSQTKLPSTIIVDEELEEHNQNLIGSMKLTRELFRQIFDIKEIKQSYYSKLDKKYKEFKKYVGEINRTERLQKVINNSLNFVKDNNKLTSADKKNNSKGNERSLSNDAKRAYEKEQKQRNSTKGNF